MSRAAASTKRPTGGRKPKSAAPAPSHLESILNAAEAVVFRDGMGSLTLDAVARQAGLSKAGLLHHVSSKDALIDALVQRQVGAWHSDFMGRYEALRAKGSPHAAIDAMMSNCLAGTDSWTESERARNRVLVAALVHDERHVEPLRKVSRHIERLIRADDLPAGVGDAIHLAVHGLWFQWIFGMGEVSASRLRNVRQALTSLVPSAAPKAARSAASSSPRSRGAR